MFERTETRSTLDLTIPTLALVFTLGFVSTLLASVAPQPAPTHAGYSWIDGDGVAHELHIEDTTDATVSLPAATDLAQL